MITIQDLIDAGIMIQGTVVVKTWIEKLNDCRIFFNGDGTAMDYQLIPRIKNKEVKYMYTVTDPNCGAALILEV